MGSGSKQVIFYIPCHHISLPPRKALVKLRAPFLFFARAQSISGFLQTLIKKIGMPKIIAFHFPWGIDFPIDIQKYFYYFFMHVYHLSSLILGTNWIRRIQ